MSINYVLVYLILSIPRILLVCSRKAKREQTEEAESISNEEILTYYRGSELSLSGNIRRYFAMEAVLSDMENNVVCSPVAAMLPLGKMACGTTDNTARSEMLTAAGITTRSMLKSTMRKLIKLLQYLPGVTLNMASNIFVSNEYQTHKEFEKKCSSTFTSLVKQVNCGINNDVAEDINQWVCNHTKGRIKNIIKSKQLCSQKSLIIANGVYFKGEWQKPFLRTYIKDFHSAFGVKQIPMMVVNDVFMYTKSNVMNAQIVEIPYKDDCASFIIVLPYYNDGLPSVLKHIKETPMLLNLAIKSLRPREMILSIPKFKLSSEIDLKMLYEKMGVNTAMNPEYSGLNKIVQNHTLHISKAIQKIVLKVTERGTDEEFIPPKHIDPIYMNLEKVLVFADRPFLFYVTVNREQLFAGIYNGIPSPLTNESQSNICF